MSRGSREWMKSWCGVVRVEFDGATYGEVAIDNGRVSFVGRELPQSWCGVSFQQLIASVDFRRWKYELTAKQEGLF